MVKKQKIVMPRKNSGMWYEVHPTPVKGENGKNLVYVRPKSGQKLTMKQLEDYCERWNMLRYGELSRAFEAFIRVAGRYLALASTGYELVASSGLYIFSQRFFGHWQKAV